MKRTPSCLLWTALCLSPFLNLHPLKAAEAESTATLRETLKDEHAVGADFWVYNDLASAFAEARRQNKPLFVTFRCVPCKACAGFDAEVAQGNDVIKSLAEKAFIPVRQVEMKGVDLSQFQFDYDLNWAAMFLNADGTVYARYGTQSTQGPDAYNSIASLEKTMRRVLAAHRNYPANAKSFQAKRGPAKPYRTALEMPGLEEREKREGPTARNNCIHCHNIHDAEQAQARQAGTFSRETLNRYPYPENFGLHIDRDDGCLIREVIAGSPAARAGLQAGESVTQINGQAILSIADIQWVLHHLPNQTVALQVRTERDGQSKTRSIQLSPGWKQTDFMWRGSRWSLKPQPGFWAPALTDDQLKELNLPESQKAMRVQWINTKRPEGRAAESAGLREGDIIIGVDDRPLTMSPEQFHMDVRLNHKVGDRLPLTVIRNGGKERFVLTLVE